MLWLGDGSPVAEADGAAEVVTATVDAGAEACGVAGVVVFNAPVETAVGEVDSG
ncbi:hypothetical protein D3C85_1102260 [compost metagenome]